jgi:hypothetical protein
VRPAYGHATPDPAYAYSIRAGEFVDGFKRGHGHDGDQPAFVADQVAVAEEAAV